MSDVILEDVIEQVEAWTVELAGWRDRVAGLFSRPEPREIFGQLVAGLLSGLPKKNGWTLAEYAGHTHPGRVQTFLSRGAWDAGDLENHVRDLVVEEMGDPEAVLIVDDTQMIKKGVKSVGVAPQHCGATNQIENCQVVVMLTYAATGGHAFIGHRLYLPERWTSDPGRCREAGIPKDVSFATKPEQAVELLAEADEAKVPFGWVAGDGGYGQYRVVRDWCTTRERRYVLAVPSSQPLARVHAIAGQQQVKRADDLLGRATRWERRSCGHGSKGERYYDWAFFTVTLPDEPPADGFEHTLLIRRSIADPTEISYFVAHAPTATPVKDMVAVAGIRWRIEECGRSRKRPPRPGPAPSPDLDRVPPPRHGLPVCPRLRRHPPRPPAETGHQPQHPRRPRPRPRSRRCQQRSNRRSTPGKRPNTDTDTTTKTVPWWRLLSTVADIIALLADRLQPFHDHLHKARWILWRQIHRARAQISHYHRRGEQPPIHLREWQRNQPP